MHSIHSVSNPSNTRSASAHTEAMPCLVIVSLSNARQLLTKFANKAMAALGPSAMNVLLHAHVLSFFLLSFSYVCFRSVRNSSQLDCRATPLTLHCSAASLSFLRFCFLPLSFPFCFVPTAATCCVSRLSFLSGRTNGFVFPGCGALCSFRFPLVHALAFPLVVVFQTFCVQFPRVIVTLSS